MLGEIDGVVHEVEQAPRHAAVAAAHEPDPHPPLVQLVAAAQQDVLVELEQEADLVGGPSPVLGAECVNGEPLDAYVEGPVHHVEQRLLAGPVTLGAGQASGLGPAPVSVHHARDVRGDSVQIQRRSDHHREATA